MSTKNVLKSAAILLAIFALGHTYGTFWFPSQGPAEDALFASMRDFTFPVMGVERSHWLFYRGFALFLSWNLVVLVVFAWQLANLSARRPVDARPLLVTLFLGTIGLAVLSWIYFFPAPGVMSTAAALVTGFGLVRHTTGHSSRSTNSGSSLAADRLGR